MEGLILSGIAITMAGNSRPASGAEHQLAHYWEMRSLKEGSHYHLHGTKVGVATPLILDIYSRVLAIDPSSIAAAALRGNYPEPSQMEELIRHHYGSMAEEILRESSGKRLTGEERENRIQLVLSKWDTIKSSLSWLPQADAVTEMLSQVEGATTPEALGLPGEWIEEALIYARHLRARYTVLDLATEMGVI